MTYPFRWLWWTVLSWVMFSFSVVCYWTGFKDKKTGNSWREFLSHFADPYGMLWRISQGWRELHLKRGRKLPFETAAAIGIKEFEKAEKAHSAKEK